MIGQSQTTSRSLARAALKATSQSPRQKPERAEERDEARKASTPSMYYLQKCICNPRSPSKPLANRGYRFSGCGISCQTSSAFLAIPPMRQFDMAFSLHEHRRRRHASWHGSILKTGPIYTASFAGRSTRAVSARKRDKADQAHCQSFRSAALPFNLGLDRG
jgi:hypothetical protein